MIMERDSLIGLTRVVGRSADQNCYWIIYLLYGSSLTNPNEQAEWSGCCLQNPPPPPSP